MRAQTKFMVCSRKFNMWVMLSSLLFFLSVGSQVQVVEATFPLPSLSIHERRAWNFRFRKSAPSKPSAVQVALNLPRGGKTYVHLPPPTISPSSLLSSSSTAAGSNPLSLSGGHSSTHPASNGNVTLSKEESHADFSIKDSKKRQKEHKKIAKKLKNRNSTNIRRKVLHASFGFLFSAANHLIPTKYFVTGMTVLSSATLLMELLRYKPGFHWMNECLHFVLGDSLRKHEMDGKFTGSFYFFCGVATVSKVYSKSSATLAILQLAVADPMASYFGKKTRHIYWSRIENGFGGIGRNKGVLGFLGGAACCIPMNYRLLSLASYSTGAPTQQTLLLASTLLGLSGAFADLAVPTPTWTLPKRIKGVKVPPLGVDDNFVVPVFAGWACQIIFQRCFGTVQGVELSKYLWV